jgi:hypothetical protein
VSETALSKRRASSVMAEMTFWRVVLPLLKRTLSLERLVRLMAAPRAAARDPRLEHFSVRVAGRLWRRSDGPCLERSLALHRSLGSAGANPTLVCGMARESDGLVGHAWVEVDEQLLAEPRDPKERYTVVTRYSASGERLGQPHRDLDVAAKNEG